MVVATRRGTPRRLTSAATARMASLRPTLPESLSAIYLATLRVWLRDDSEDMAKTMAHLDKQLARVDSFLGGRKFPINA